MTLSVVVNVIGLDDNTFVMVSESDLEGYNADALAGLWEISIIQFGSKVAFARF
jgi:atypical dual specificity phosphatase